MSVDLRKMRKEERERSKQHRKDRLIQTRVDRRLQGVLVEQARRRRMSVSNLVRGVLEDAFGLADPDVGPLVDGSDRGALATAVADDLAHVYAWNAVVLGKSATCSRCHAAMTRGASALIGLSEDPDAQRAWLCSECGDAL
ncbi:MAG: hypothetical protein JKY37_09725 [Nannocystaceae bacterium]|nr:hypothetical protein [Nannocystaceae bacterium]